MNLFAEMLLRLIALEYGDGTETAGIGKVMELLLTMGIDTEGMRMHDGCGLAPADRVTAHLIVELLRKMKDNEAFVGSLPVAGKTGTIYSFLKGRKSTIEDRNDEGCDCLFGLCRWQRRKDLCRVDYRK